MRTVLHSLLQAVAGFFVEILKTITRIIAFVGTELTEVIRRPGVLFSLILGPFLIMALFGIGYSGYRRPLDAVVVVPPGSDAPRDPGFYQQLAGNEARILEVTEDLDGAREMLRRQLLDLVVVAPSNLQQQFASGRQSTVTVEYNQIDPVEDGYVQVVAYREVQELNRVLIEGAAGDIQKYAVQVAGVPLPLQVPPEVVASPTRAQVDNLSPSTPTVVQFYAPAVLALVLQHMAVTLTALSLVRERLSGAIDLFRVAPVRTAEILAGKYLAYGFLNLAIAAAVAFLLVGLIGVPILGPILGIAGVIALLTFASLGLGLLISTVADSERQAVQLSMLVLLASVFLSGFVLPLEEFTVPVRWAGYALPVTYGIRLMQDMMLRGGTNAVWQFWALGGFGIALSLITAATLRHDLKGSA